MGLGFYYEDFSWDWDFKEIQIDYICKQVCTINGSSCNMLGI
jgi:hypothetical protein